MSSDARILTSVIPNDPEHRLPKKNTSPCLLFFLPAFAARVEFA